MDGWRTEEGNENSMEQIYNLNKYEKSIAAKSAKYANV